MHHSFSKLEIILTLVIEEKSELKFVNLFLNNTLSAFHSNGILGKL
jgi:hypothetical protein